MAGLITLLFIARDRDGTRTVAMETAQESFAEKLKNFAMYSFSFYLTVQMVRGHFAANRKTLTHLSIVCSVLGIVSYFGIGHTGSLFLVGGALLSTTWLPRRQLSAYNKAILITGCDRGIGHNLAIHLDRLGFFVFAGFLDLSSDSHKHLVNQCSERLRTVQMDVSNSVEVDNAKTWISKELMGTGVEFWGVVNNAGICYIGNVEIMCKEDMNKIMAVNYFGPVNVCKTFLPLLRKSRGRIVNIASNAGLYVRSTAKVIYGREKLRKKEKPGLAPVPLMGVYCASKAALASMTEVWRYEFKVWGIQVSTVIPSGYKTGIIAYDMARTAEKWWSLASDAVKQDYGKECFNIKFKQKNHDTMLSANFTEIQNNVGDALLSVSPHTYYYNGFLARTIPFLYLHLPSSVGDPIVRLLTDWFDFKPCSLKKTRSSKNA